MLLFLQALHKISLRDSVCTARVSSSLLSLISLLVDLGVLADASRRRRLSQAAAKERLLCCIRLTFHGAAAIWGEMGLFL